MTSGTQVRTQVRRQVRSYCLSMRHGRARVCACACVCVSRLPMGSWTRAEPGRLTDGLKTTVRASTRMYAPISTTHTYTHTHIHTARMYAPTSTTHTYTQLVCMRLHRQHTHTHTPVRADTQKVRCPLYQALRAYVDRSGNLVWVSLYSAVCVRVCVCACVCMCVCHASAPPLAIS